MIRAHLESRGAWEAIYGLIRAPQYLTSEPFYANVDLLDDCEFQNLSADDLLLRVPSDYPHSFLLAVGQLTVTHSEFPVLIIALKADRGRSFRAIPSQIQGIENNLSIANMDYFEFADCADDDGIFGGIP
ncbi:MAG: hypothetical protein ABI833_11005 [Acidobacteriota bacterium]